ncbi:MAG: serine/threonine protein kinase [Chloroflexi bacterium]|nr:MAG: serine/threonine protein kinase [Chloroflexota bacterium]
MSQTTERWINTTIGRYKILEVIGSGGMARVYRAWDTNLERPVAVKILHEHLSNDTFKERFEREAKLVAALNHPNIVQIYDFDSIEIDGHSVYYMVMAYISGPTLANVLAQAAEEERTLPHKQILSIMMDITSALSYAHERGMVHRDVKPSNILFDEDGRAVLTDFGIARLVEGSNLTQEGITIGTPTYMSPEQATGGTIDARSDIYSLGIILYEMLSGQPPFPDTGGISVLLQHVNAPIPKLSEIVPIHNQALDTVIFKALAKTPQSRYQSATEFAEALKSALNGEPITSSQGLATVQFNTVASDSQPSVPPNKRKLSAPIGLLAIGALIIAGLLFVALLNRQSPATPTDDTSNSLVESMTGDLFFSTDFSRDNPFTSYWHEDNTEPFVQQIDNGVYRLINTSPRTAATTLFDSAYTYSRNITITLEATLSEDSSPASGYGIVFNYQDENNYNVFAVDGLGRYSIWVRQNREWRELRDAEETWTEHPAIHPRGEKNQLTIHIDGNLLHGYVNGVNVVNVEDSTFTGGAVGIYLATTSEGNTEVQAYHYAVSDDPPLVDAMTDEG